MTDQAFKELFYLKYNSFCNYANSVIKDRAAAEDIVQEIFIDFWKKQGSAEVVLKVENYLIRAVKYKCLDYLRKQKVRRDYVEESAHELSQAFFHEEDLKPEEDLKLIIRLAIDQLPLKTREVFILSKLNKLSYKAIAVRLGIAEKTVENQMSRAFRLLRVKLKEYEYLLMIMIYFLIQ